jgi:hypothetical protein
MLGSLAPLGLMLGLVAAMVAPGLAYAARIRRGEDR